MIFRPRPLSSGGIHLTYQCPNRCGHCIYASGPSRDEWMSEDDLIRIYSQIRKHGRFLTSIHLGGGEPFLRPDFLERAVRIAVETGVPLDYVETNAFWAWDEETAFRILSRLKEAGLNGLLVSASPFHLEFVPIGRVRTAVSVSRRLFEPDRTRVYTDHYFDQFRDLDPDRTVPLDEYVGAVGEDRAAAGFAGAYGLIPGGRAAVKLAGLYAHRPAREYFGETCEKELSSPHHIHIDPEGHYIAGLCSGLSLGDGRDLDALYAGIDLSRKPV
ncbi:MAG TPA: radical SAM protein, partial [bacterium]|nr:radical SAM protein [bacterium]